MYLEYNVLNSKYIQVHTRGVLGGFNPLPPKKIQENDEICFYRLKVRK